MTQPKQPNILFVMADQLTAALTGPYGHKVVQTPNMDRLTRAGITFDAAYTPSPLCGPARASFITGKYISRLGVYDNATAFHTEELAIPHYLGSAGYDCVASGKLHYVGPDQLHGFARRLTTDIYPADYDWLQHRDPERAFDPAQRGRHAHQYVADAITVGDWQWNLGYDEETQFRALEYLRAKGRDKREKQAAGEGYQPFFLFASFHHPHDPFRPPQEYWDLYENAPIDLPDFPDDLDVTYSLLDRWLNHWHQVDGYDVRDPASLTVVRRAYYALVTYIDRKLGELLDALERVNLAEDTIVVFASDHGDMLGERGMVQKRVFYEWSSRVPLIVRFPDGRSAGTRITQPVSLVDLLPTYCDLAGVEQQLPHDGHSLMLLINGEASEPWDVFCESHAEGVFGSCFMLREARYKYVYILHADGEDEQLFDLQADPGEWHNLAYDAAYAPVVADLRARLFAQFDPPAVERDVQASFEKRKLLRRWWAATGATFDYVPNFDPTRNSAAQYLP